MRKTITSRGHTPAVRLFPGFPLPDSDYSELLDLLEAGEGPGRPIVVAHSRGALDALASGTPPGVPLFLLAPSVPRHRSGTGLLKASLLIAGRMPVVRDAISRQLREGTYRRYGADAPPGLPLDLETVARRLRVTSIRVIGKGSRSVVVVVSLDDARYEDQVVFARQLGATVLLQPGGHLFPITHPDLTASTIMAAST